MTCRLVKLTRLNDRSMMRLIIVLAVSWIVVVHGDFCMNGQNTQLGVECGDNQHYCGFEQKCCGSGFDSWCCQQDQNCGNNQQQGCVTITQGDGIDTVPGTGCGINAICSSDDLECCESNVGSNWCCPSGSKCGSSRWNCTSSSGSDPQYGRSCGSGVCEGVPSDNSLCCGSSISGWCCATPYNSCGSYAPQCETITYQYGMSTSLGIGCGSGNVCAGGSGENCCQTNGIHYCCPAGYGCDPYNAYYCVPSGNAACDTGGGDAICCETQSQCCGYNCCSFGQQCCNGQCQESCK